MNDKNSKFIVLISFVLLAAAVIGAAALGASVGKDNQNDAQISESNSKIDKLLSEIMSSPLFSSRTGDYIQAHKKEYDELVIMGEEALPYLIHILDSGDKGLRGNIVQQLCGDIAKELSNRMSGNTKIEKLVKEAYTAIDRWNASKNSPWLIYDQGY